MNREMRLFAVIHKRLCRHFIPNKTSCTAKSIASRIENLPQRFEKSLIGNLYWKGYGSALFIECICSGRAPEHSRSLALLPHQQPKPIVVRIADALIPAARRLVKLVSDRLLDNFNPSCAKISG
jgi:hypothetical protein